MLKVKLTANYQLENFKGHRIDVGTFDLHVTVDALFFIGTQLVALSPTGKIGVWNSVTQHWQTQV